MRRLSDDVAMNTHASVRPPLQAQPLQHPKGILELHERTDVCTRNKRQVRGDRGVQGPAARTQAAGPEAGVVLWLPGRRELPGGSRAQAYAWSPVLQTCSEDRFVCHRSVQKRAFTHVNKRNDSWHAIETTIDRGF